ncbi:hypothetical protein [Halobaculum marinum]|uniref:Uncharacterized protein n=1 Tax=Halobaculum marinum TaxID=3031996 RepID=A0ABD5X3U0_9EURY|nr:hypothetical protein [Halobaculum sp. DT55]
MKNPHHTGDETPSWTDLSSTERTILYMLARIERDRDEQNREVTERTLERLIPERDLDYGAHNSALGSLTDKELLTNIDGKYFLTDAGQRVLRVEYARLGSVLDPDIHGVRDSFPSCPNCGDPVTEIEVMAPGCVRAGPCGCQLPGPLGADPLIDSLGKALQLTADDDARYHLRQAMQLAFARSHHYTDQ